MKIVCVRTTYQNRRRIRRGTVMQFKGKEEDIPPYFELLSKAVKPKLDVHQELKSFKAMQDEEAKKAKEDAVKKQAAIDAKKNDVVISDEEMLS